jgi:hypothetical protein
VWYTTKREVAVVTLNMSVKGTVITSVESEQPLCSILTYRSSHEFEFAIFWKNYMAN